MNRLSAEKRDELMQMYCKAHNLVPLGSTVFPRKMYYVYQALSLFWICVTGAFTLWGVYINAAWLMKGLIVALVIYAAFFILFHWKFGIRRDIVEQEIEDMVRTQR